MSAENNGSYAPMGLELYLHVLERMSVRRDTSVLLHSDKCVFSHHSVTHWLNEDSGVTLFTRHT